MLYIYTISLILLTFIISKIQVKMNRGNIGILLIILSLFVVLYKTDNILINYLDYSS